MENEIIKHHFEMLIMMGTTGMIWWVSGLAFCMSLLKSYISMDTDCIYLVQLEYIIILFFISIIIFGLAMSWYSVELRDNLLHCFNINELRIYGPRINIFFNIIKNGILIGTSSFFLFFLVAVYAIFSKKR